MTLTVATVSSRVTVTRLYPSNTHEAHVSVLPHKGKLLAASKQPDLGLGTAQWHVIAAAHSRKSGGGSLGEKQFPGKEIPISLGDEKALISCIMIREIQIKALECLAYLMAQ